MCDISIKMIRGPTEAAYEQGADFCATPLTRGGHAEVHFQTRVNSLFHVLTCAIAEEKPVCGHCQ